MTSTITYVGHGTVLIERDGVRLLTDPILRRWLGHLRRYGPLPDVEPLREVDAILLSHLHLDHVDRRSLRLLDKQTRILTPPGGAALLSRLGFTDIVPIAVDDRLDIGGLPIRVLPARHDGRRHPFTLDGDSFGFLIGDPDAIYFAGDTTTFDEMSELSGHVDTALLPIWGWGPMVDEDEHLTPLTAAHALQMIQPRVAIPVHWGTLIPFGVHTLSSYDPARPPRTFVRYASHLTPQIEVRVLQPGETTDVTRQTGRPLDGPGSCPYPHPVKASISA